MPLPSLISLEVLPSELQLHILSYLDIPDLLTLTRTSQHLRILSLDPLLHIARLQRASRTLLHYLPLRPSLAELMAHRIYITRTTLAARNLGRNLIRIKLNRQLLKRPTPEDLVQAGVLPRECWSWSLNGGGGKGVAPALVDVKRRVERERIKDRLRGWVEEWRRRGCERRDGEGTKGERVEVWRLVRRFARDGRERDGGSQRWGAQRRVGTGREAPARAKVLVLRKFWERVGREGDGSSATVM